MDRGGGAGQPRGVPVDRDRYNACRFDPASEEGHYESYFQRANHPSRPLGWWIRYTIFCPKGRPEQATAELWAIWFDGERGTVAAAKQDVPFAGGKCAFARDRLSVVIGDATLDDRSLRGAATGPEHAIAWELDYDSPDAPLLLLPAQFYNRDKKLPRAKALVGAPNAVFSGTVTVDGEVHQFKNWVGSQCHNWGSRHTDRYAWGQVAGFDGVPDSFLECATARLRFGPLWTPPLTLLVLRVDGEQFALNSLIDSVRARGEVSISGPEFTWRLASRRGEVAVEARLWAPRTAFVGLLYKDPPGGAKTCLNSKIAGCELTLRRPGRAPLLLRSANRAAFEVLTDQAGHGVPVVA